LTRHPAIVALAAGPLRGISSVLPGWLRHSMQRAHAWTEDGTSNVRHHAPTKGGASRLQFSELPSIEPGPNVLSYSSVCPSLRHFVADRCNQTCSSNLLAHR
jgi:hypothetical protein